MMFNGNEERIASQIRLWLDEDIGNGDVTTLTTIPLDSQSKGIIHVKESGIAAGLPIAELVFRIVDPTLVFVPD